MWKARTLSLKIGLLKLKNLNSNILRMIISINPKNMGTSKITTKEGVPSSKFSQWAEK